MNNSNVSYIFPSDINIELFSLPKTATQDSISFKPREYIIEQIIPQKNKILKDIFKSEPDMPFGYINKGEKETKTIEEASNLLDFKKKYILKTLVTRDLDENIYMVITLGNYRPNINNIRHISKKFRDAHDLTSPPKLYKLDSDFEDHIGMSAGFCGPVLYNEDYMKNIKGILFHTNIKKKQQRYTRNAEDIMITFPISKNASILMHPGDLYEKLKDKCGEDKIAFFKE
ncbi:hypothetical protein GQ472_04695 [archaeon]|nr:hypothetical protein [archaeon]